MARRCRKDEKTALIQAAAGCGLTAAIYLLYRFFLPTAQDIQSFHYDPRWTAALMYVVRPVFLLLLGWSLVQVLSLAAAVKLPERPWVRCLRRGSFGHCSLRYPVLTLCLYRLICRCRECLLGSQAVSLSDHKVESKTDFPFPFGCASLSSGLSAEAKGPGRKTDFSIKATVPRALLMAPFFHSILPGFAFPVICSRDAPDRCLSPALRKIAMASGVLWCQSHAQQPHRALFLSASSVA